MSAGTVGDSESTSGRVSGATATADLLYDAFCGAAIGGSVIALFFLVLDSIGGQPLFTPSLIGTALFSGAEVGPDTAIRLDMVAYFSVVHFAGFLALGAVISTMCRWTGLSESNPVSVTVVAFLVLSAAFFVASAVLMPGVGEVIGLGRILAANLVTGASMGWFMRFAHSKDEAQG